MRVRAKVDGNHAEIIAAIRAIGGQAQSIANIGGGSPDVLAAFRGVWYVLEIKDGALPPSKRQLTPDEAAWHARYGAVAPVYIVNSIAEALHVLGAA